MDGTRVGILIKTLRQEKGLTQRQLAQQLCVSDKAVSKWERGMGCPDVSLIPAIADAFGVDIKCLLTGQMTQSRQNGGNMKRIRFYMCPECGNVMTAAGDAEIACCGRKLSPMKAVPCDAAHAISIEPMDGETYISFAHGMSKDHHIRFVALAGYDRMLLVRLYPEQGGELRVPYMPYAVYYIGCSKDGLFTCRK